MIVPYNGMNPRIHDSVFIAEGAQIIGDVEIGRESSVWFNAVIRGDVNVIRIGERTNIQDLAMLHVTYQKYPLVIGSGVTVGHSAVLHASTIHDHCLIGMGAVILDDAEIESHVIVAAGALVLEHFKAPAGTLIAGVPARVKRDLTHAEQSMIEASAQRYLLYVSNYRKH